MAQAFTGTATISTAEYSLTGASGAAATQTTSGIVQLVLGLQNMVAGDSYRLKIKEKVISAAGTQRDLHTQVFTGVQGTPHAIVAAVYLCNGWDFTLTQLTGAAARSIDWSVRQMLAA